VSSSAALTLAVVAALATLREEDAPDTAGVCALARQAETAELGTGAGWMDFLACAWGGVNRISAGSRPHADLITTSLGLPVVLIDTRQRRATATVLAGKRERYQAREPRHAHLRGRDRRPGGRPHPGAAAAAAGLP